ncbi:MAG: ATP-grasp domain-containing protein [Chloroflexi bacterium]|nr:ATP-grasp domain-containing protein [Chloroflexota bacterium]
MRLYFIRPPRDPNPLLEEVYALLRERGCQVEVGVPDETVLGLDVAAQHDLYILKAREPLPLSVAGMFHYLGARVLNPYDSCTVVMNKYVSTAMMRAAGIPTPRSWAATDLSLLNGFAAASQQTLIIKPYQGIHGDGIFVVRRPEDLESMPAPEEPMIVQEFIDGCRWRYKVFGVGERIFATRKPFGLGGRHGKAPGQQWVVTPEMEDIALRCGRLFGLGLYGLDILEGPDGPVVVDVNTFPGYGSQPGIAHVIAEYIEDYARGRYELRPPAPLAVASAARRAAVA